jgi:hypothetical protein
MGNELWGGVMHTISEYDADKVMEFIELHSGHGPVIRHLQDMHKLRDMKVCADLGEILIPRNEYHTADIIWGMTYGS